MKKKPITVALIAICLAVTYLQTADSAEAYPILEMSPKVNVPETNVNATIYKVNGTLWARIDAEYTMHAVYAYGDSYLAENYGMGLILYPDSPYVMVTVTQDVLEAHYPVPRGARNISVSLNGEEVEVQQDAHGFFHIFDVDLAEINWTVSPVPDDFVVTVHYEQPIPEITETYAYLGDYAVTLPLYGRYGCSNISYPLYSWYGYPSNDYRIQIESRTALAQVQVYSVDAQGTLTPLNPTLTDDNVRWVIAFCRENESSFVHGAVLVFSAPPEESFPFPFVPLVAATTVISVAAMAGLLVYFKKRHVKSIAT
ncbi:MAG: hypothetical protein NWE99_09390 [Candidatus Bathyarchaeota archaeon]|nr:hypothetical protein [Candidatus Bathyarchaeota archaeon]